MMQGKSIGTWVGEEAAGADAEAHPSAAMKRTASAAVLMKFVSFGAKQMTTPRSA